MADSVALLRMFLSNRRKERKAQRRQAAGGRDSDVDSQSEANSAKSLSGYVFQHLALECLRRSGIDPIYPEAFVTFVPVAQYDIIIPTEQEGLVNLSLKTSLRERWKQAEFEGIALKRVHRRSRIYVVNADLKETAKRRRSIDQCEAIDDFIYCASPDFDALVESILRWKPTVLESVPVIAAQGRRHPVDEMLGEGLNTQRVRIQFRTQ